MTNNSNYKQTPASFLIIIRILHGSLLVSQVLFALVVLYLQNTQRTGINQIGVNYIYVVAPLSIAGFFMSNFLFKTLLAKAKTKTSLKEILTAYQAAFLTRLAFLEGPSLMGIVTYHLTGNLNLLIFPALLVLYFFTIAPTKEKIENDLELSLKHKMEFGDEVKVLE